MVRHDADAADDEPWIVPFPSQGRRVVDPARRQRTIRRTASVTGVGYWSGKTVTVEFRPAPEDHGRVFVRAGEPPVAIPALVGHRAPAERRTNLAADGVTLQMVEHVLAALAALEIDNVAVHLDGDELPGCDGSALDFTEALVTAGVVAQERRVRPVTVTGFHRLGDDHAWIEVRPTTLAGLTIRYELDFPECPAIGRQVYQTFVTPDGFRRELAPARTFIREAEAKALHDRGLATHVRMSELLVFGDHGPIGNTLRYADECVRHKILDLVGDLALAGRPIHAEIAAYRSGHRLNGDLTELLLDAYGQPTATRRAAA